MYVVFFTISKLWLKLKDYSNTRNKQIVIYTCKILPFLQISQTQACKMIPFSWIREFAPPIEKMPPFSRKWVRAWWYTFWSGVGKRHVTNPKTQTRVHCKTNQKTKPSNTSQSEYDDGQDEPQIWPRNPRVQILQRSRRNPGTHHPRMHEDHERWRNHKVRRHI